MSLTSSVMRQSVSNFRLYCCSNKIQMLRKNVKSLLEQLQVCIFAEIVFGIRCTLTYHTTRNTIYDMDIARSQRKRSKLVVERVFQLSISFQINVTVGSFVWFLWSYCSKTDIRLESIAQIYLHIALGGVGSIQQGFVSSPLNWKTALKIEEFKRQLPNLVRTT